MTMPKLGHNTQVNPYETHTTARELVKEMDVEKWFEQRLDHYLLHSVAVDVGIAGPGSSMLILEDSMV